MSKFKEMAKDIASKYASQYCHNNNEIEDACNEMCSRVINEVVLNLLLAVPRFSNGFDKDNGLTEEYLTEWHDYIKNFHKALN